MTGEQAIEVLKTLRSSGIKYGFLEENEPEALQFAIQELEKVERLNEGIEENWLTGTEEAMFCQYCASKVTADEVAPGVTRYVCEHDPDCITALIATSPKEETPK